MSPLDHYLIKLKGARLADEAIAARLGWTLPQVQQRWIEIQESVQRQRANGYIRLAQCFEELCLQYQLVGNSLRVIAAGLGQAMPEEEIKALIRADPAETLKNLTTQAIVLKVFAPEEIVLPPPPIARPEDN